MKYSIVIAADKSGSGKTTLTCGLIHVLKKRGLRVQSFKCGPDYIDPMFHRKVLRVPSANLDSFFVSREMLRRLYAKRAEKADISVIEGVMGYYDGLGGVSAEGSTWEIADIIDSPTVLVMDCKGASVSIAALIRGMIDFGKHAAGSMRENTDAINISLADEHDDRDNMSLDDRNADRENFSFDDEGTMGSRHPDSGIRGVILNRVSPMFYERLKGVIEENCPEIKVLGYMPEMKSGKIPSRHLGLIEPGDMEDFNSWIEAVSEQIEKTVDVDRILEISEITKSGVTTKSGKSLEYDKAEKSEKAAKLGKTAKSVKSPEEQISEHCDLQDITENHPVCSPAHEGEGSLGVDDDLKDMESNSELVLKNKVRLGVAEDEAFNFYYQENRELLEKMGAEMVPFSLIHDEKLPEDLDGIIIGGGYPELYAEKLSANISMREAVSSLIRSGIPVIAECGGYMYLNSFIKAGDDLLSDKINGEETAEKGKTSSSEIRKKSLGETKTGSKMSQEALNKFEMCGVFSGEAEKKERLVRFGYVIAETKAPGLFGEAGMVLKGHEFHRYDCEYNGNGFVLRKPGAQNVKKSLNHSGKVAAKDLLNKADMTKGQEQEEGRPACRGSFVSGKHEGISGQYEGIYYNRTMSCGWPHFYYYSNPKAVFNFMKNCERYHFEREAQKKWDMIAKPIDSLGILEKQVIKLCGIQRTLAPSIDRKALVVLCGDHGCVKEGVTQTDSSVTRRVADSFAKGTTTTAIIAEANGVDVYTVDVGMTGPRYVSDSDMMKTEEAGKSLYEDSESHGGSEDHSAKNETMEIPHRIEIKDIKTVKAAMDHRNNHGSDKLCLNLVNDRRLQNGSGNIAVEAAMSHEVGEKALQLGIDLVWELKVAGYQIICTGEMGIGNTTPTAALLAFFMRCDAEEAVGYGAGLSEEGLKRKQDVVRRALWRLRKELEQEGIDSRILFPDKSYRVSPDIAKEVLFRIGGLEIAVMAGMFLGAVRYEVPIVIDGIISTAAALSAYMMDERVADHALASHVSKEKLPRKALEKMGLRAIIDAEMSLGEGSGAVLLMPILSSAVEVFNHMRTFLDIDVEAYHRFRS